MSHPSGYIPEGVKVLIASASAYLGAYLYQIGYAGYFGLPREIVTVSLPNLLLFGATIVVVVILSYQFLSLFITIHDEHGEVIKKSVVGMVLKKWGIASAIGLSLWLFSGYQLEDVWGFWYLILFVSLDFIVPIFRSKETSYAEALREWIALSFAPKQNNEKSFISSPQAKRIFFLLVLFILASTYCLALGRGEARRRKEFGFIGEEAIVARYDDQLVMCRFDSGSGQFTRNFRLLDLKEATNNVEVRKVERTQ